MTFAAPSPIKSSSSEFRELEWQRYMKSLEVAAKREGTSIERMPSVALSCWRTALSLPSGRMILSACEICLEHSVLQKYLPSPQQERVFCQDGSISLPDYFLKAIKTEVYRRKNPSFNQADRFSNNLESPASLFTEELAELLDFWATKTTPEDFPQALSLVINAHKIGLRLKACETFLEEEICNWSYVNPTQIEAAIQLCQQLQTHAIKSTKKVLAKYLVGAWWKNKADRLLLYLQQLNVDDLDVSDFLLKTEDLKKLLSILPLKKLRVQWPASSKEEQRFLAQSKKTINNRWDLTPERKRFLAELGRRKSPFLEDLALVIKEYISVECFPLISFSHLKQLKIENFSRSMFEGSINRFNSLSRCTHLQRLKLIRCGEDAFFRAKDFSPLIHLNKLNLSRSSILRPGAVSAIATLTGLKELNLASCKLLEEDISALSNLTRLNRLGLAANQIKDQHLNFLSHLPVLSFLDLSSTQIEGSFLSHLFGLNYLKKLSLHGCKQLKNTYLERVGHLTQVKRLNLSYTNLPNETYSLIGKMTQLISLKLNGNVTLLRLQKLTNLQYLKVLDMGYCLHFVDFANLPSLRNLTSLSFNTYNQLDFKAFPSLRQMPSLRHLNFRWSSEVLSKQEIEAALEAIGALKNLEELLLEGRSQIPADESFTHLSTLQKLRFLSFGLYDQPFQGQPFPNNGAKALSYLLRLKTLKLSFKEVSDRGLQYLAKLDQLRSLSLPYCDSLSIDSLSKLKDLAHLHEFSFQLKEPHPHQKELACLFKEMTQLKALTIQIRNHTNSVTISMAELTQLSQLEIYTGGDEKISKEAIESVDQLTAAGVEVIFK